MISAFFGAGCVYKQGAGPDPRSLSLCPRSRGDAADRAPALFHPWPGARGGCSSVAVGLFGHPAPRGNTGHSQLPGLWREKT